MDFQEPDRFVLELFNEKSNEKLPIKLFQKLESDLSEKLANSSTEDDETDRPLEFIQNIVNSVRAELEGVVEEGDKNFFSIF